MYGMCHNCTKGHFSNVIGRPTSCEACHPGQYQTVEEKTSCTFCIVGKFGTKVGAFLESDCKNCVPGQFQDTEAKTSCKNCVIGKWSTDTGRSTDCDFCDVGQYQHVAGSTSCINCVAGKFHQDNTVGADAESHCITCPNGKWQQAEAKHTCTECASSTYSASAATGVNTNCTACLVRDDIRYWWTEGNTGWGHCVKHPLACLKGNETAFSTCTKSCKKTTAPETYGDKTQYSQPIYHAWGGGSACSADASIYNTDANQDYRRWEDAMGATDPLSNYTDLDGSFTAAHALGKWEHTIPCNLHYCPIDCVVSGWTQWNVCSSTCGTDGTTQKTRSITTSVQYGGKICPTLENDKACNNHTCATPCNDKHTRCAAVQWNWHDNFKVGGADFGARDSHPVHHATGKSLTRHVYTVGGEPCPNNTEACFATKGIH